MTFPQLFRGIFLEPDETVSAIFDLRFPRIMISMLAGAAVAVSGVLFQAVLKESSGRPGDHRYFQRGQLCGGDHYSSGARPVFLHAFFCLSGRSPGFFPGVYPFWKGGLSPLRIILVGVAVNSMFTGLSSAMNSMSGGNMSGVASIVNGNITMKTWRMYRLWCLM